MSKKPSSFTEILDLWPSPKSLSDDLGVPYISAQQMKRRKSVGMAHWPRLIELLAAKGVTVTNDDLVNMALSRRQEAGEAQGAAA